jgi:hypothetical protein
VTRRLICNVNSNAKTLCRPCPEHLSLSAFTQEPEAHSWRRKQTPSTNTIPRLKMHSCRQVDSLCYPAKVVGSSCTPFLLRLPVVPRRVEPLRVQQPRIDDIHNPESFPNQTTQPEPQSARSRPALPQAHHHEVRRHQPADGQQPTASSPQQLPRAAPRQTDKPPIDIPTSVISRCQHQYAKKILSLRYCTTDSARQ